MKKALKIIGIVLASLFAIGIIAGLLLNQPKPEGQKPEKADKVAQKMLNTLNYEAYQNTQYLTWTFAGIHHYVWDKKEKIVAVSWDENKVVLNTENLEEAVAFKEGKELKEPEKTDLVNSAWAFFCNDSFWLVAPYKVFDSGVKRSLVMGENKTPNLLVEFASGGVTPGDAYLWQLDSTYMPIAYQMWVSIIPIGGLKATWGKWTTTSSGAILPQQHKIGFMTIPITEIKAGNSLAAIGWNENPFATL